jgi:GAF domain-containing protein
MTAEHGRAMGAIDALLAELLVQTGASRATLRQDLPGPYAFPVAHEALAPGAPPLREEHTVDLRAQPVVQELLLGRQVVQDDCASAYPDEAFQRMLETYGGLAAQIVTPIFRSGRLEAILSLHQLKTPRRWTSDEIAAATRTAARLGELL